MPDITLPLFALQPETKEIPLTQGKVAIVDAADYEWLSQWKWYAHQSGNTWYARRNVRLPDGTRSIARMHREILGVPLGVLVDHKNLDGLDNRRDNLRPATRSENGRNRPKQINNTSGYKGVTWDKQHRKWRTQIIINGKHTSNRVYADLREAVDAYDDAARTLFGEFARPNFAEGEIL